MVRRLIIEEVDNKNSETSVNKILAKNDGLNGEPPRNRTSNLMIKRYKRFVPKRKDK